jgi:hypothetical protein
MDAQIPIVYKKSQDITKTYLRNYIILGSLHIAEFSTYLFFKFNLAHGHQYAYYLSGLSCPLSAAKKGELQFSSLLTYFIFLFFSIE